MAIQRFQPIVVAARKQLNHSIATAGLDEVEQAKEEALIGKVAAVISDFMAAGNNSGVALLGAFRVMFSTCEALAGNVDEIIDEHEQRCGCDGSGKNDPNGNGGLLH